jgi:hypothetical protein
MGKIIKKSKPVSRVLSLKKGFYHLSGIMITHNLYQPTHPDVAFYSTHKRATSFRDLFGLSTPEVYRPVCHHT